MDQVERETVTITTPVGNHEVVLKAYLTGKEDREIRRVFSDNMTLKVKPGSKNLGESDMKASLTMEAQEKALSILIVSVNGKTDSTVDAVLDMHKDDTDFVIEKVDEITSDTDEEEKKS